MRYKRLEVSLESLAEGHLPHYHGSMLRGVLGTALMKSACAKGHANVDCNTCSISTNCPYVQLFKHTSTESSKGQYSNIQTQPNPYVVYPLQTGLTHFKNGDHLKFRLTLIGRAVDQLHYYIHAINELNSIRLGAARLPFRVASIMDPDLGLPIQEKEILHLERLHENNLIVESKAAKVVRITFDTPVKLVENGQFVSQIGFHHIVDGILRRIGMSEQFMDEHNEQSTFHITAEKRAAFFTESRKIRVNQSHTQWNRLERKSILHTSKDSIGGVTGSLIFEGDLDIFIPLLQAGSILHIGKATTMGCGHYEYQILK